MSQDDWSVSGKKREGSETRQVKCVVWDLDDTVWDGTLLEGDEIKLREPVRRVIEVLDQRGILHSIASRNESQPTVAALRRMGIEDFFLYPQIGWNPKSESIKAIAKALNLGLDAFAFVDDQAYEREEVAFSLPQVMLLDAADVASFPEMAEMNPRFVTDDSRRRRAMYRADQHRQVAEGTFEGPQEAFLSTLGMRLVIAPASEDDLQRAEELTVRTHQLNSTGYTYDYEALDAFRRSDDHDLWIAELEDRFGSYGKIGLALVQRAQRAWTLKLFLMSCRVMSRGVGSILLNWLLARSTAAGVPLRAEFVPTGRNRIMYVTYRFAGFEEAGERDGVRQLESAASQGFVPPPYVEVVTP